MDPPSSAAQVLHFRTENKVDVKLPGLTIGVCFLGATLVALGNHITFSRPKGTPTSSVLSVDRGKRLYAVVVLMLSLHGPRSSLSQAV